MLALFGIKFFSGVKRYANSFVNAFLIKMISCGALSAKTMTIIVRQMILTISTIYFIRVSVSLFEVWFRVLLRVRTKPLIRGLLLVGASFFVCWRGALIFIIFNA